MKLLYCRACKDLFNLVVSPLGVEKQCTCGAVKGHHVDAINAVASGPYLAIGIDDSSFYHAQVDIPQVGTGNPFMAYIMPHTANTLMRREPQ